MKKISILLILNLFASLSFGKNSSVKNQDADDPIQISLGQTVSITLTGVFEEKNFHLITDEDGYLVCKVSQTNPNGTYGAAFFLNWEGGCCGTFIGSNISGTDVNQFIGISAGAGGYNITLENGSGGENSITFTITIESTNKKNDLEPNDTYANANQLQLNTSKTGHINFVDPSNRSPDVIDIYKFNALSIGNLQLDLKLTPSIYQSGYNLAWIALLDSNLNFITEDSSLQNATINYNNLSKGWYYIRVIARLDRQTNPYIYGNGYKLSNKFYSTSPPSVTIANKSTQEGNAGNKQLMFPVTLSGIYTDTVKIKYQTKGNTAKGGSDYAGANGTLIFKPGQTSNNISVTINGDTKVEPDEIFYVILSNSVNATIAHDTAIGKIRNDDGGALTNELATDENIKSKSFTANFQAYPNPVKDILHIQTTGNTTFYLSNAEGKLILTKQVQKSGSINISKLSAGLYFLRNELTGKVQKIVIEK